MRMIYGPLGQMPGMARGMGFVRRFRFRANIDHLGLDGHFGVTRLSTVT